MIQRTAIWIAWACGVLNSASAFAEANLPRVGGRPPEGQPGIFLLREPYERYWEDWRGVKLNSGADGQSDVYIHGEGYKAIFNGIISINCENGKSFWIAARDGLGGPPEPLSDSVAHVPQQVVKNAVTFFCKPSSR